MGELTILVSIPCREDGARIGLCVRLRQELLLAYLPVAAGVKAGEVSFAAWTTAVSHPHARTMSVASTRHHTRASTSPSTQAPGRRSARTRPGTELDARQRSVLIAVASAKDGSWIGVRVRSSEKLFE
jgi:hypothetical protein